VCSLWYSGRHQQGQRRCKSVFKHSLLNVCWRLIDTPTRSCWRVWNYSHCNQTKMLTQTILLLRGEAPKFNLIDWNSRYHVGQTPSQSWLQLEATPYQSLRLQLWRWTALLPANDPAFGQKECRRVVRLTGTHVLCWKTCRGSSLRKIKTSELCVSFMNLIGPFFLAIHLLTICTPAFSFLTQLVWLLTG
jgi:hypothetical protein